MPHKRERCVASTLGRKYLHELLVFVCDPEHDLPFLMGRLYTAILVKTNLLNLVFVRVNLLQLDWLAIADWAYASIFAVAVQFQDKDQFWIPHQKLHGACVLDFLKNLKMSLFDHF